MLFAIRECYPATSGATSRDPKPDLEMVVKIEGDAVVTTATRLLALLHTCRQTRAEATGNFFWMNVFLHRLLDFDARTMLAWYRMRSNLGITVYNDVVEFSGSRC